MNVCKAHTDDIPQISVLFEDAIAFMREKGFIGWKSFDRSFLESEIGRGLVYKIVLDDTIAASFSICFADPLIWREKERGDAVYLHRIVRNRHIGGSEHLFKAILDWTQNLASDRGLQYIRMDTWADNTKLIGYYNTYGFHCVETYTTPGTEELPEQHRNLRVMLLQKAVSCGNV